MTNHLLPDPMTRGELDGTFKGKELFPGKWKEKVRDRDFAQRLYHAYLKLVALLVVNNL